MANDRREINGKKLDYPSNSKSSKRDKAEKGKPTEKKVDKITKGTVVKKKKSLGKKFTDTFLSDEFDSVGDYLKQDVLIPAAKNLFSDVVSQAVEMIKDGTEAMLFGEVRGSRKRRGSYVSYNTISTRDKKDRRDPSRRNRATHNFDDIVLETRGEAEEVRDQLLFLIDEYGDASVADLYSSVGITGSFTDNRYGWSNLSTARIIKVRDGYLLDLPKPRLLD